MNILPSYEASQFNLQEEIQGVINAIIPDKQQTFYDKVASCFESGIGRQLSPTEIDQRLYSALAPITQSPSHLANIKTETQDKKRDLLIEPKKCPISTWNEIRTLSHLNGKETSYHRTILYQNNLIPSLFVSTCCSDSANTQFLLLEDIINTLLKNSEFRSCHVPLLLENNYAKVFPRHHAVYLSLKLHPHTRHLQAWIVDSAFSMTPQAIYDFRPLKGMIENTLQCCSKKNLTYSYTFQQTKIGHQGFFNNSDCGRWTLYHLFRGVLGLQVVCEEFDIAHEKIKRLEEVFNPRMQQEQKCNDDLLKKCEFEDDDIDSLAEFQPSQAGLFGNEWDEDSDIVPGDIN